MARSDLLVSLVRAGASGDEALFRKTVEAIIAEERAKRHNLLADELMVHLRSTRVIDEQSRVKNRWVHAVEPRRSISSLFLPVLASAACQELVEEHHRRDLLRSHGLEPRHRVLLSGPPGNGKTSLAEALAYDLMADLYVVRYDAVIGSYLGETASRLAELFSEVRTRRCVLFFDEFDTLGKERGDLQETGEVKRVVSSLLLQIDALPSHVVVVTATNHPELLDRAVWRRFQVQIELPNPKPAQIRDWIETFQKSSELPLNTSPKTLSSKLSGLSFAEVEEFFLDIQRRYVLQQPEADMKALISQRLKQWASRLKS
ncbi:MAG: AAA family ATPase [Vulcanimicrobiota bacterium]